VALAKVAAKVRTALGRTSQRVDASTAVRVHARAVSGKSCQGRLYVANSRGPGARTASSGRHGPYACWHAYRDVLQALFDAYPDARVRTSLANYIGRDGFERDYPATGWRNVGSQMEPRCMPDLCDCGHATEHVARTRRVEDFLRDVDTLVSDDAMRWSPDCEVMKV
jgi:hypothetical protein